MAGLTTSLLRFLLVAVVAAGAGTGIYFAARSGSGGNAAQVAVRATSTPAIVATATAPAAIPTSTEAAATATESPAMTPVPALPPPPPRPAQPAVADGDVLVGGEWYQFQQCLFFYLPGGRNYRIHVALNDPGGYMSVAFEDEASGSIVAFSQEDGSEVNRSVVDPGLSPAFDQIAATFSKEC
jgi:hypothetical protein